MHISKYPPLSATDTLCAASLCCALIITPHGFILQLPQPVSLALRAYQSAVQGNNGQAYTLVDCGKYNTLHKSQTANKVGIM